MPLIHAIEVANFMNYGRKVPWSPDWRHSRFLLKGLHTAINIPNGRGKSTIMQTILSMLIWDTTSLRSIKRMHWAPVSSPAFTHVRIEITNRNLVQGGLFASISDPTDGEHMVFGLYGNASDDNPDFYAYHGVFNDCPVATVTADRTILLGKEAFLENLSRLKSTHHLFPTTAKERQGGEWKQFVGDFFDMSSLLQQHKYQVANGAEGSAKYFDVDKDGGNYSAELFYKHLAPELLSELMGGYGANDEHGIEDTIHEKARGVVVAKRETDEKTRELESATLVLETLEGLHKIVETISKRTDDVVTTQARLAAEYFALREAVVLRQMPGVPSPPTADLPTFYNDFVLQDGQWWLTDSGLGNFSRDDAKQVNQRAGRNPIVRSAELKKSQVIDFKCDLSSTSSGGSRPGWKPQLYSKDACFAMLAKTNSFDHGWNRERALAEVKAAFDWIALAGDTNPARRESLALELKLESDKQTKTRAGFAHSDARRREQGMREEMTLLSQSAMAWETMDASKLFTPEEMTEIAKTADAVKNKALVAQNALSAQIRMALERESFQKKWVVFVNAHANCRPGDIADHLEHARAEQRERLEDIVVKLSKTSNDIFESEALVKKVNSAWQSLANRIEKADELTALAQGYTSLFGETDPTGLEEKVLREYREAKATLNAAEATLAQLADSLNAISAFELIKPGTVAVDWLSERRAHKAALREQIDRKNAQLEPSTAKLMHAKQYEQAARNFRSYYDDQSPVGLEAVVSAEFQNTENTLSKLRQDLAHWKTALDALQEFQNSIGAVEPTVWMVDLSHRQSLAAERLQRDSEELTELRQLRSALDDNIVAPGAAAREVAAVAGPDAVALHEFVHQLKLDDTRNASVLTLFSALLFAPVFSEIGPAKKAAVALAREGIEVPTFLASSLEQFCRSGAIAFDDDIASNLLVGIKTRKVACLLDPRLIEMEKQQLEQQMAALEVLCHDTQKELDDLAVNAELVPVAALAAKALAQQLPTKAASTKEEISRLTIKLPQLKKLASHDAIATIRASLSLRDALDIARDTSSLSVESALERLVQECEILVEEVTHVTNEIVKLRDEDSLENTAEMAAKAIVQGVPEKAEISRNVISVCGAVLAKSQALANPDAIQSIRAQIQLKKFLNGDVISEMEVRLRILSIEKVGADANAEQLYQLRKDQEYNKGLIETAYRKSQDAAMEVQALRELQEYVDDAKYGPAFMATHEEETKRLNAVMLLAQQRERFDFNGAHTFVVGGGALRLNELRQTHTAVLHDIESLDELIKNKEKEIDEAQIALKPLQQSANQVDMAVLALCQRWQKISSVLDAPRPISTEQLEQHIVWAGLQRWRSMTSADDIALDMGRVCDQLATADDTSAVETLRSLNGALKRAKEALDAEIDRTLVNRSLKLPETARVKLLQAKASPKIISEILVAGQASHAKNEEANRIANEHLTLERSKLSEWLTTFTMGLPDNLKTLRSVFSPSHGAEPGQTRAGFDIEATIIDSDGINRLIEKIICTVENLENGQLASAATPEKIRKNINKTLRDDIRDSFYRGVILNPRIRLVLPSISARPLLMEKDMASSGQGVAITFLWILKLAEFINEREIRRQSVDGAKRKRLRDKASAFAILDGAFSHLSDKRLINETLAGIENSLGRFQLIITGHDPAYENDFKRFPALVVGREMNGRYMRAASHHHQLNEEGDEGLMEAFNAIHIPRPGTTEKVHAQ